jgi:hypothetical protein
MTLQHELVTDAIFVQIASLAAVLLGIYFIGRGARISKLRIVAGWQEKMWLRHVRGLARDEEPRDHSAEVLQAAQRQWLPQFGAMTVGAGIGILIGLVVCFALAQVALRAPFSLPFGLFYVFFIVPVWGGLLGNTWSSIFAARRQQPLRIDDLDVARPEISHKISDYRSPLVPVIVAFPAVVYTALTVLLAPHYQPFSSFELRYDALIPPPRWILAIYPCALWLHVLLVEGCAWARVRAPAAITSPDTTLARRLSMGVIGEHLSSLYGSLLIVPSSMGLGAVALLQPTSEVIPYGVLSSVVFGTLVICGLSALQMMMSQGRLGGRLTGWPWSKERTRRVASAEG